MTLRVQLVAAAVLLFTAACSSEPPESSATGDWVGTITTEGNVTTVVNESGSIWNGTATLVEEASIGVEIGDNEYMLGRVNSVWSDGERIFVVDLQVPAVRAYDWSGNWLYEVGKPGQGPGEFLRPAFIGGDGQGRLFVDDTRQGRINVYSLDGEYLEQYPVGAVRCCTVPMLVRADASVLLEVLDPEAPRGSFGERMRAFDRSGPVEIDLESPQLEVPDHTYMLREARVAAPFAPSIAWKPTASGGEVFGASHRYRFEIRDAEGYTIVVERITAPILVSAEEHEWRRRDRVSSTRRGDPNFDWNGAEMPAVQPAFSDFVIAETGEIWVIRPGPGVRLPQCDPDMSLDDYNAFWEARCWGATSLLDVFDGEGRYLGDVVVPEGLNLRFALPWISAGAVVGNVYDPSGTIMVKRYRLVLPGEDGR